MSDTPLCDAYERDAGMKAMTCGIPWRPMDFARKLERENAKLREAITAVVCYPTSGETGPSRV